jgi:hypothetical protein
LGHFGRGPDQDAHRLAGIGRKPRLQRRHDLRLALPAVEHYIAAGDVGAHATPALGLAHRLQLGHRQLAGTADIHRAQQGNMDRHRST